MSRGDTTKLTAADDAFDVYDLCNKNIFAQRYVKAFPRRRLKFRSFYLFILLQLKADYSCFEATPVCVCVCATTLCRPRAEGGCDRLGLVDEEARHCFNDGRYILNETVSPRHSVSPSHVWHDRARPLAAGEPAGGESEAAHWPGARRVGGTVSACDCQPLLGPCCWR